MTTLKTTTDVCGLYDYFGTHVFKVLADEYTNNTLKIQAANVILGIEKAKYTELEEYFMKPKAFGSI